MSNKIGGAEGNYQGSFENLKVPRRISWFERIITMLSGKNKTVENQVFNKARNQLNPLDKQLESNVGQLKTELESCIDTLQAKTQERDTVKNNYDKLSEEVSILEKSNDTLQSKIKLAVENLTSLLKPGRSLSNFKNDCILKYQAENKSRDLQKDYKDLYEGYLSEKSNIEKLLAKGVTAEKFSSMTKQLEFAKSEIDRIQNLINKKESTFTSERTKDQIVQDSEFIVDMLEHLNTAKETEKALTAEANKLLGKNIKLADVSAPLQKFNESVLKCRENRKELTSTKTILDKITTRLKDNLKDSTNDSLENAIKLRRTIIEDTIQIEETNNQIEDKKFHLPEIAKELDYSQKSVNRLSEKSKMIENTIKGLEDKRSTIQELGGHKIKANSSKVYMYEELLKPGTDIETGLMMLQKYKNMSKELRALAKQMETPGADKNLDREYIEKSKSFELHKAEIKKVLGDSITLDDVHRSLGEESTIKKITVEKRLLTG